MRWAISVPYGDVGLREQADLYAELADVGYTDYWSLEASGWDAFTPLAIAALRVPHAHLGTAIVPVFSRGAAVLASSAAAIAELAGDRFTLGVGASTQVIMGDWNGVDYTEPFKRTRDTVTFLRAALSGEKVTADYDTFSVRGFRLDRAPEHVPELMVAALRPGMLRMAGTVGDGAILSWLAPHDVPTVAAHVGAGKRVAARIFVCPSDDDDDAVRPMLRRVLASYLNAPVYRAFHEWLGRGEQLAPMWSRWEAGDRRGALEALPDEVVDDLAVHGRPEKCRERIEQYVAEGVDVPIVLPLPLGTSTHEAALSLAPR